MFLFYTPRKYQKNKGALLFSWGMKWEPLRKKCANTEFFLGRIFLYLARIRRFTEQISVFSPNTEKYGPEKISYLDTFHAKMG